MILHPLGNAVTELFIMIVLAPALPAYQFLYVEHCDMSKSHSHLRQSCGRKSPAKARITSAAIARSERDGGFSTALPVLDEASSFVEGKCCLWLRRSPLRFSRGLRGSTDEVAS